VQRTLREMTADEVELALEWAHAEAEPAHRLAVAIMEGRTDELSHVCEEFLWRAYEAADRNTRLMVLVEASIPQWRGTKLSLHKALRRWWPGGRKCPRQGMSC
jgi:hypothetical protein